MPWTTSAAVMKVRRKNHIIDTIVEMLDGWRRHLSGRNASLLSFFTFLSVFPLMLAATTILGFVLEGNPDLQKRLIEGAADEIPLIGDSLGNGDTIEGSVLALAIGLLGALWSSTKAFVGLQSALDDTWEVHIDDRPGLPVQRGRAIVGILILGASQVGNIAVAAIITAADIAGIGVFGAVAGSFAVNVVVLAAMYRFLTSAGPSWADVLPGAIMAGVIFTALQHFGPTIVRTITENAGDTYGDFATVLGLVTWLGFLAIGGLMAAELNAAIVRLRTREPEGYVDTLGADFDLSVRT